VAPQSAEQRARAILDAWNLQALSPIRELRFPVLSEVAEFAGATAGSFIAAEAASYRIQTRVRTEDRKGANAPMRVNGAASRAEAEARLPAFRPVPGRIGSASTIDEASEHIVDVVAQTCSPCRGTGSVDCPSCRGEKAIPCKTCNSSGSVAGQQTVQMACPRCNGSGALQRPCVACDQRGWNACQLCESNGFVQFKKNADGSNGVAVTPKECTACAGSHRRVCGTCGGHRVLRTACAATVSVQRQVPMTCPTCHGSRSIPCKACLARGHIECSACGGFRNVYLVTLAHRVAIVTPITTFRSGPNSALASSAWLEAQRNNQSRTRLHDIRRSGDGLREDQLEKVGAVLGPTGTPFMTSVKEGAAALVSELDASVLVSTVVAPAIAFTAAVGDWNATFLELDEATTFGSTEIAPTDPAQKDRQTVAYAAWRPIEVARLENEYQLAVVDAADRREKARDSALGARPWHRVALVALAAYAVALAMAWWVIVRIGIPLETQFAGVPRRLDPIYGYFIVAFLGALPAIVLRRRLVRLVVNGIAAIRPFAAPVVEDPARTPAPAELAPSDWVPIMHAFRADEPTQPRSGQMDLGLSDAEVAA